MRTHKGCGCIYTFNFGTFAEVSNEASEKYKVLV